MIEVANVRRLIVLTSIDRGTDRSTIVRCDEDDQVLAARKYFRQEVAGTLRDASGAMLLSAGVADVLPQRSFGAEKPRRSIACRTRLSG